MADKPEKRLTPEEIENLTCDLLRFCVKWGMFDNCIFSGGKWYRFALPHRGEKTEMFHDLPGVVIKTLKPENCFFENEWKYVKLILRENGQQDHILSMAIDGSLYELLNYGVYEMDNISALPEDVRALLLKLDPALYKRILGYDLLGDEGPVLNPLEFDSREEYMEFEDVFRPPEPDVTLLDWRWIDVHYSGYNDPVVRAIRGEFDSIFDKYGVWHDSATASVLTCCYHQSI